MYYPITARMILLEHDYIVHIHRAEKLLHLPVTLTPHFLYQLLTIIFFKALPVSMLTAGLLATLFGAVASALIIFHLLNSRSSVPLMVLIVATVSLLLVAPIPLFFPSDSHLYLGYIGINVLHNPTMVILKPCALLLFYTVVAMYEPARPTTRMKTVTICILLTLFSLASKPSHVICFLPAVALKVLLDAGKIRKAVLADLVSGFFLPALLILALQYLIAYDDFLPHLPRFYEEKCSIIWAPLLVMKTLSPSWLAPKFLLSILFPGAVLLLYLRESREDLHLVLAWMTFACGAAYSYLLAESAPRTFQGNFVWSGEISLFILFVVSAHFFLDRAFLKGRLVPSPKNVILMLIFLIHTLSGIILYAAEYASPEKYW
jgi:hypothetical protein